MSTHEWMALMEAMALGLHESSLDGFYHLCRTLCVKDIALYDAYDEAFLAYFKDIHIDALQADRGAARRGSSDPQGARGADRGAARGARRSSTSRSCASCSSSGSRSRRSATTAATAGSAPAARRRSAPAARTRRACASAAAVGAARWRSPTSAASRSTAATSCSTSARSTSRCAGCAGSAARARSRSSISTRRSTRPCKNAGELEIVFRPPRRNRVKVVLLMDVGGSMDPHAELMSRLFTAASRAGRFAKFRSYYFHNCVYNSVYEDAQFRKARAGRRPAREQRSRREARGASATR